MQYFDAAIALGKNDLSKARDMVQQVLKRAPEHVPSLVLAGAVELQAGQAATAEGYLRKAVSLAPEHAAARRMLVRTYLGSNQPAKALESIQPLLAIRDAERIRNCCLLAGETYLANGDLKQASRYYAAATDSKPQESVARTRLGQIALASGDPDAGIRELEAAVALDGAPMQADVALIVGHVKKNDLNSALQAANALAKKYPANPLSHQMLGVVYMARKDFAAARAAFAKALELNPTYLPAIANLARLDIAEKKPADARKRFEAVIAKDPKNEQALLALADVMARTGAPPAEIVVTLQRAVSANPQSVAARLALIGFHLRVQDFKAALSAAQDAAATSEQSLASSVRSRKRRKRLAKPIKRSRHEPVGGARAAVDRSAGSPCGVVRQAKDYPKAVDSLRRAQKLAPGDPAIARDLVLA